MGISGSPHFVHEVGGLWRVESDGSLRWRFDAQGPISSSPVILPDGSVCFGTKTGVLWCLQADAALATAPWPMFQRDARHSGLAPSVLQPPELPTGLRAEAANGCAGVIRVSWNSSPGADHYEVWRSSQDDPDSASALTTHQAVNLVFDDDTATFDTLYY